MTTPVTALQKASGPTPFVVERDGEAISTVVDVTRTQRFTGESDEPTTVGAIGISAAPIRADAIQPRLGGARDVRLHR